MFRRITSLIMGLPLFGCGSKLEVAERVAWFGCPANAEAEIKKSAAYVSPHPEVEGVLDILERLSK